MKRAVHFGAGNIGRGFLGQLYFESGYTTTFIDVADDLVSAIHERNAYPLRIVDENPESLTIENVDAVDGRDLDAVAAALAAADIASTAVGVGALPHITKALAGGIQARFANKAAAPLDIIVCENLINAGPYLREQVRAQLDPAFAQALDERVGFVEASIGRMVPVMTSAQKAEDPLLVCVEAYCDLPVDAAGFKGPVPAIKHMTPMAHFEAYVERKLFVHNLSHGATAYFGHLRNHEYIWQAIRDGKVRERVDAATRQSCAALHQKHGLDPSDLEAHRLDLVRRYHNKALGDQVVRVGRDPVRKLGPKDRLIGAARMCEEQGLPLDNIAVAAAAGICYNEPGDEAAQRIQAIRVKGGLDAVLSEICHVSPGTPLAKEIENGMQVLQREGWIG